MNYVEQLSTIVNQLVKNSLPINVLYFSLDEAKEKGFEVYPGVDQVRVIQIDKYTGCGCGGTHLKNTNEIGEIKIKKITSKKGLTKIMYSIKDEE